MYSIFYSVYSESVLTAEYLFPYGIKVTEQLDVLGPCMDYAVTDSKQYRSNHCPKSCLVIVPKRLGKKCEKYCEANNKKHLS